MYSPIGDRSPLGGAGKIRSLEDPDIPPVGAKEWTPDLSFDEMRAHFGYGNDIMAGIECLLSIEREVCWRRWADFIYWGEVGKHWAFMGLLVRVMRCRLVVFRELRRRLL